MATNLWPDPKQILAQKKTVQPSNTKTLWPAPVSLGIGKPKVDQATLDREQHARDRAQAQAQSLQIDEILKKEQNPGFIGQVGNFLSSFKPSNIASTAKTVAQDIKQDPAGAITAIPKGLFDVGSVVLNTAGRPAINLLDKISQPFVGKQRTPNLPIFSQELEKMGAYSGVGQYGQLPAPQTDTANALRESATNVGAFELGGAGLKATGRGLELAGVGRNATQQVANLSPQLNRMLAQSPNLVRAGQLLQNGIVNRTAGNILGGQLVLDPKTSLKDRAKQSAFDAAFGLVTEGLGKTLGLAKKGLPRNAPEEAISGKLSEKPTGTQQSTILYKPKKNLGVDGSGEKILAKTEFDNRTGRAIIYFDESLDSNPTLKAQTIDHELGHVLDKRINKGSNLSAELPNYKGNQASLDETLSEFAKEQGISVEQLAKNLQKDINKLAKGSNEAEAFANAVAEYRKNPELAQKKAPTLSALIERSPLEEGITDHVVTAKQITSKKSKVVKPEVKSQKNVQTISKTTKPIKIGAVVAKIDEKPVARAKPIVKTVEAPFSSTGLKTGRTVKTKSFNPSKINAPDETQALFDSLGKGKREFNAQRIAKNNEDIRDLARLTGLTEEQLIKAKPGSIANAETVTAARQLVLDKAQDLMNYLKKVDVSVATPEQLQGIKDRFVKLVAMQKSVAGLRTEASNVFRSLGLELMPGENATLAELGGILKKAGVASGDDAALFSGKAAKEFNLTKVQKLGQGALSTWYSAILSGPKTTARNILSTSANILTDLASKSGNPKLWKEIPSSVSGLLHGIKDSKGEAWNVLLGKKQGTTKFMEAGDNLRPSAFDTNFANKGLNKVVRTYGTIVESVGRFLNAQDTLLKGAAKGMEIASLKVQKIPEGELSEAIADAYGETSVYHGVPKGRLLGALRDSAQTLRTKFPESKVIIPFVDTVANVLDRQFDYLPITSQLRLRGAVLDRQVERIAKDYNITSQADKLAIKTRLRDQQVGRMVLGTAISGAAIALAANGRVSGVGPTNVNERNQLQEKGWRPNSIKIGDTWVPYSNLGPLAGIFAMAGNVYDKTHYDKSPTKDISSLIGKGIVGWTQTQLNSSFLSGAADLLDVMGGGVDPKKYLTNLGAGLIPIPATYTQTKDIFARQQYETKNIQDKLKLKLGITGGLEPKLTALGKNQKSDLIYGISPSKDKNDPVLDFLVKNDLVVGKPYLNTQYSIPGTINEKRALKPAEYTRYIKESGYEIYRTLEDSKVALDQLPSDLKKKQVQKIIDETRERVRKEIMLGS